MAVIGPPTRRQQKRWNNNANHRAPFEATGLRRCKVCREWYPRRRGEWRTRACANPACIWTLEIAERARLRRAKRRWDAIALIESIAYASEMRAP